jgi:hypothetical protein
MTESPSSATWSVSDRRRPARGSPDSGARGPSPRPRPVGGRKTFTIWSAASRVSPRSRRCPGSRFSTRTGSTPSFERRSRTRSGGRAQLRDRARLHEADPRRFGRPRRARRDAHGRSSHRADGRFGFDREVTERSSASGLPTRYCRSDGRRRGELDQVAVRVVRNRACPSSGSTRTRPKRGRGHSRGENRRSWSSSAATSTRSRGTRTTPRERTMTPPAPRS